MDELKPCPICGNEAKFVSGTATIKCTVCGCAFIVTDPCISRYEVSLVWNTRKGVSENDR